MRCGNFRWINRCRQICATRANHNEMKKISIDLMPVSKNASAKTAMSFTSPNPMPPDLCTALLTIKSTVKITKKQTPAIVCMQALGSRNENIRRKPKKDKSK